MNIINITNYLLMISVFDTSELYHLFLNAHNDKSEIQNIFLNKIYEFGFY